MLLAYFNNIAFKLSIMLLNEGYHGLTILVSPKDCSSSSVQNQVPENIRSIILMRPGITLFVQEFWAGHAQTQMG